MLMTSFPIGEGSIFRRIPSMAVKAQPKLLEFTGK